MFNSTAWYLVWMSSMISLHTDQSLVSVFSGLETRKKACFCVLLSLFHGILWVVASKFRSQSMQTVSLVCPWKYVQSWGSIITCSGDKKDVQLWKNLSQQIPCDTESMGNWTSKWWWWQQQSLLEDSGGADDLCVKEFHNDRNATCSVYAVGAIAIWAPVSSVRKWVGVELVTIML